MSEAQTKAIRSRVVDSAGDTMIAGRIVPAYDTPQVRFALDACQDLALYGSWRKTKCRPRDDTIEAERLEDLDQATHEFVGEVAELGELLLHGQGTEIFKRPRLGRLVDEIGDIWFTGMWLLDAWQVNSLVGEDGPHPNRVVPTDELETAQQMAVIIESGEAEGEAVDVIMGAAGVLAFQMGIFAGLLCNAFKKERWQQRKQDPEVQGERIRAVLSLSAHLLAMAGCEVSNALASNMGKLDRRYPNGFQADGPGGGIRDAKGGV